MSIMDNEPIEREPTPEAFIRQAWDETVLPYVAEELHPIARDIIDDTINEYSDGRRKYHTLDHIADCIKKLEPYKEREDYLKLFLALLWHDEVYDTDAHDNEEKSGEVAAIKMGWLKLPGPETVRRLIVVTKHHNPGAEDEALMCDIDMSILAEDEDIYRAYSTGIREEYGQYSDEEYYAGRLKALESFSSPFKHPDFIHMNEKAEHNTKTEIKSLRLRMLS